jgi:hypothetical protein
MSILWIILIAFVFAGLLGGGRRHHRRDCDWD